jgi:hypothetical protein
LPLGPIPKLDAFDGLERLPPTFSGSQQPF